MSATLAVGTPDVTSAVLTGFGAMTSVAIAGLIVGFIVWFFNRGGELRSDATMTTDRHEEQRGKYLGYLPVVIAALVFVLVVVSSGIIASDYASGVLANALPLVIAISSFEVVYRILTHGVLGHLSDSYSAKTHIAREARWFVPVPIIAVAAAWLSDRFVPSLGANWAEYHRLLLATLLGLIIVTVAARVAWLGFAGRRKAMWRFTRDTILMVALGVIPVICLRLFGSKLHQPWLPSHQLVAYLVAALALPAIYLIIIEGIRFGKRNHRKVAASKFVLPPSSVDIPTDDEFIDIMRDPNRKLAMVARLGSDPKGHKFLVDKKVLQP